MPSVISPADFSHVTAVARPVKRGETVEVDAETAAQLIAQGWSEAAPKPRKPAQSSTDVETRTAADTDQE